VAAAVDGDTVGCRRYLQRDRPNRDR
jgi:hypothetical protein